MRVLSSTTVAMLLFWTTATQARCPSKCTCTSTAILCVNQSLEAIPNLNYLKYNPVILDFSGNSFLFLDEDDFDFPGNEEVKEIYLNDSGIADIGSGTFSDLESLQELYLGQNFLDSVPDSLIEDLNNMVLLDLSNNYFNGDMPTIRSTSLEVFALANSKVLSIPDGALKYLPNLKLLLLHQNYIKTISFEPFKMYPPSSFFVKLSYNSWTCSCDNIRTFQQLSHRKFIETSVSYQCIDKNDNMINIFNKHGNISHHLNQRDCHKHLNNEIQPRLVKHQEVRDMVDESRKNVKNLKTDVSFTSSRVNGQKDIEEEAFPQNVDDFGGLFRAIFIATIVSFLIGFAAGMFTCKIVYMLRYKKLEQSSDSRAQLL